jgi:copper(I)-binding protein
MLKKVLFIFGISAVLAANAMACSKHEGNLRVTHPWAYETSEQQKTAGLFMDINNMGLESDVLLSAETDIAEIVEIHSVTNEDGIMKMRSMPNGLELRSEDITVLKPKDNHVMLINLKKQLKAGDEVPLTLKFKHAGEMKVNAVIEKRG